MKKKHDQDDDSVSDSTSDSSRGDVQKEKRLNDFLLMVKEKASNAREETSEFLENK